MAIQSNHDEMSGHRGQRPVFAVPKKQIFLFAIAFLAGMQAMYMLELESWFPSSATLSGAGISYAPAVSAALSTKGTRSRDFELAYKESLEFFDDVSEED